MAAEERERLMWQKAIRLMLLVDGPTGHRPFWYPEMAWRGSPLW